jgi:hypothetical protein
MPIASIWPETACESHVRTPDIDAHLTTSDIRNIINLDLRKQTAGGRHQIGMLAGFRSEWVAGFVLECMAGFVGIRKRAAEGVVEVANGVGLVQGEAHGRVSRCSLGIG